VYVERLDKDDGLCDDNGDEEVDHDLPAPTGVKPRIWYYCGVCAKSFTTKAYLFYHLNDHKQIRSWSCVVCWQLYLGGLDLMAVIPKSDIIDQDGNLRRGKKNYFNPIFKNLRITREHWNSNHAIPKIGTASDPVGNDDSRGYPTWSELKFGKSDWSEKKRKSMREYYRLFSFYLFSQKDIMFSKISVVRKYLFPKHTV